VNCKINTSTTNQLLELLIDKSFLHKLGLVNANMSEQSIKLLITLVSK